jgi:hypothetical protein
MNNNATKNKLALKKTSLRELSATEWEMVGGGATGDTEYVCSQDCPTFANCSYTCLTDTCTLNCQLATGTCYCSYGCLTDTCTCP